MVSMNARVAVGNEDVVPQAPPLALRCSSYPPIAVVGSVAAGHVTRILVVVLPIVVPTATDVVVGGLAVGSSSTTVTGMVVSMTRRWFVPRSPISYVPAGVSRGIITFT